MGIVFSAGKWMYVGYKGRDARISSTFLKYLLNRLEFELHIYNGMITVKLCYWSTGSAHPRGTLSGPSHTCTEK